MTEPSAPPQQGMPIWADLTTPDPTGARAFYGALFGWDFAAGLPDRTDHVTAQLDGRPVAGIGAYAAEEQGSPSMWTSYVAVTDLDAALRAVEAAGGRVFSGPTELGGAARTATVADPEGAVFGLWQAGKHPGHAGATGPGTPSWAEVWSGAAETARTFYTGVLGITESPAGDEGFTMFEVAGEPAFGVWSAGAAVSVEGTGPHWLLYFATADTDATAARVRELGGSVHAEPDDSPFGRWALFGDPAGARFAVVGPAPGEATTG